MATDFSLDQGPGRDSTAELSLGRSPGPDQGQGRSLDPIATPNRMHGAFSAIAETTVFSLTYLLLWSVNYNNRYSMLCFVYINCLFFEY